MLHWQYCVSKLILHSSDAAAAKPPQSCSILWDPIDGSPPCSALPGILQARTLEWVAISFSNAWKWKVKSEIEVAQSCPTLHNPMDSSLPGSSVHGIFQARILEWVAIAFSTLSWYYEVMRSKSSKFSLLKLFLSFESFLKYKFILIGG